MLTQAFLRICLLGSTFIDGYLAVGSGCVLWGSGANGQVCMGRGSRNVIGHLTSPLEGIRCVQRTEGLPEEDSSTW